MQPLIEKDREKRIAVLSDTHNLLRPEVLEILASCCAAVHAGDISSQKVLGELENTVPLFVVRGNNDKEWAEEIPQELYFELLGLRFYMTHKKKDIPKEPKPTDLVIFGHSHKYEESWKGSTCWLNPGSCGPRRFSQPITMAVITREESGFSVERIDLLPQIRKEEVPPLQGKDLTKLMDGILKDMQKGKTIREIAKKYQVTSGFAEQVCRIYVTHPGVTARGILDKMEVNSTVTKEANDRKVSEISYGRE